MLAITCLHFALLIIFTVSTTYSFCKDSIKLLFRSLYDMNVEDVWSVRTPSIRRGFCPVMLSDNETFILANRGFIARKDPLLSLRMTNARREIGLPAYAP